MKEPEIQKNILKKLREKGFLVWRVNNTGIPDPSVRGGWRKQTGYNMTGMSDILGVYKGRFLAIEVKTPERIKNVSEKQQEFLNKVRKNGGIAMVADSLELVLQKLKEHDRI
jgi:penicillin-binding protein-related factor A (putative recombinase)